jgi:subtilisin family serine protease
MDDGSLFLSARVSGRALGGSAIPYKTLKAAEPGGPSGPGGGGTPPAPEPRLGNDRTEIFIDALTGSGYHPSWSPINAQYMVAIEGRNGEVISSVLYKFSGDDQGQWKWDEVGHILAATGGLKGSRLETGVPSTMMPQLGSGYGIFVRTTDWDKTHQDTGGYDMRVLLQFSIASFDPLEGDPVLPEEYIIDKPVGYFIVQFSVPVTEEIVALVESRGTGNKVLDFVPTYGMVVRVPSNDPSLIEHIDNVRYVGTYQPAFRLDSNLFNRIGDQVLLVTVYNNVTQVAAQIAAAGGDVESISGSVVKFRANMTDLPLIARIPEIKLLGPFMKRSIKNDIARGITNSNAVVSVFGLTGKGQIIAVADTGLDTGNDADHQPNHPDVNGRVIKWYDVAKANGDCKVADCTVDVNGHGTHVTGTAVGAGNASEGKYHGVAPDAKIIFQATDPQDGSGSLSLPGDLHDLYKGPFSDGARVHQNSWGDPTVANYGDYSVDSENTDDFIWGNDTMLIVFAAGNAGADGSNTTESPGTSKNVLTVGASENYRPYYDSAGDNIAHIASFSSIGNTTDGRIKPDIVAPGTWILSTLSSKASGTLWWYYNTMYQYSGGTSMAAPHVSGAALIARQYYTDYQNITPSAALIKATLINGADDLGTADIPNKNEGWGRLNLTNSLFPQNPRVMKYFDERIGLNSSDADQVYKVSVGNANVPLKITLVWSDYKGNPGANQAAPKLVNNLDLKITAPNGTAYNGNVFSKGWSTWGGSADILNNVECVYLPTPSNGTYTLSVKPKTITKGPQDFALVVSGELVPDLEVSAIATDPASPQAGTNVWINATVRNKGSEDTPPILKSAFSSLNLNAITSENMTDIAFSHDGKFALIVGSNRTILKYTTATGTISKMDTSTVPWTDFEGVAFNPKGHPWDKRLPEALLVGTNGTIVDYNGSKFINVTGPSSSDHLLDVGWNENGTQALIVGKDGIVYTFPKTTTVLTDDFESGSGNWYFNPSKAKSHWGITNTQSVSTSHSMAYSFKGPGSAVEDQLRLLSKQDVSGGNFRSSYLEFQNRYDNEIYTSGNTNYITVFWLYFTNDNSTYTRVATFDTFLDAPQGWYKEHFDINRFTPTQSFNMLFYVASSNVYDGHSYWWVDDVFINKTTYVATKVNYPTGGGSAVLNGVAFAPGTDRAVIVGDDGVAWKLSAGALTSLTSGTSVDLRSISFKPQSKTALIVGDSGTVQTYNSVGDTFTDLNFINSSASLYDVVYRQDHTTTGQSPDCSQALIVGSGGGAWQYFGYDNHFEQTSTGTTRTLYGAAYNNTRWPQYGPGLVVGHGSNPVVLKDTPSSGRRPFKVNFYKGNASASWAANYLGQVTVTGGLAPDPYPPYDSKVIVSFHWIGSDVAGKYNVTARVDITKNESASPANPDRINEIDEWNNNQLSTSLTLVPEFEQIMVPIAGTVVIVLIIRKRRRKSRKKS